MENNALKRGYVMVPRRLLVGMFENHGEALGDEEAFFRLLVHVNYRSASVSAPLGKVLTCERGESTMPFARWERILGWSYGRVRRFFGDCFRLGSVGRAYRIRKKLSQKKRQLAVDNIEDYCKA